jgi:acetyl-CoA synthetase (ADP-forming)
MRPEAAVDVAGVEAMARLCRPRSIAVVGASEDTAKFGGRVMHQLVRHGYAGRLYPINPRRQTINGLSAYPSVSAVPEPPDAAIVAVPPAALAGTVRDCVAGGVGVGIVITGNLALGDDDGSALEAEVVAIARAGGMRLLGPNCLGVISPPARLAFSPSVTMAVDALPAGRVGIASQSGALMTAMFMRGHDAGVGFSSCISVGNQADLELADAFRYLVDDPHTGAVCLYVEGVKDLARFREAAARARDVGKPVVAVKAGRTPAGASMASSHTRSLAGSYEAFGALCERLGIVVTDSAEAAVLCADALARHGAPRAPGLAVLSGSGGAAVLASDAVSADGALQVARPSSATRAALETMTAQPVAAAMIDLGGYRTPFRLEEIRRTLELLAADPVVGAVVYLMTPQPLMAEVAQAIGDLVEAAGMPVAFVSTAGSVADVVHAGLRARGVVVHTGMDDALRVLRALMDYRRLSSPGAALAVPPPDAAALEAAVAPFAPGLLTEPEARRLLQAAGVPVTRGESAGDADAAASAAARIGYPVVLKGVARGLVHKSDAGAVHLGIDDAAALRLAFDAVRDAVAANAPGARFEGCSVQEMASGGVVEAFVGARHDPQHGPVVLLGAGGVLVELIDDDVVLAAPVDPAEVEAKLRTLASWPLFDGARGRPRADVAALAAIVSRVSALVTRLGPHLAELDVNPVLVRAAGEGALALDARAVWSEGEERS